MTTLLRTDWDGYLKLLEASTDRRLWITYDRGEVEIRTPSTAHQRCKKLLAQLVETTLFELGMNSAGGGSTTFRRQALDRGLEPDECYWIGSPPEDGDDEVLRPDLVLEVEVSRSALDRMGIFAAFGVPEVWRLTADLDLLVEVLGARGYERCDRSPTFPDVDVRELPRFVRVGLEKGSRAMLLDFREWLSSR